MQLKSSCTDRKLTISSKSVQSTGVTRETAQMLGIRWRRSTASSHRFRRPDRGEKAQPQVSRGGARRLASVSPATGLMP